MSKLVRNVCIGVGALFFGLPLIAAVGPGMAMSAARMNAPAARDLTCTWPVDHVCPANANRFDQEDINRGVEPKSPPKATPTMVTSIPEPKPYGPANGPVKPLPSATIPPPPELPEPEPVRPLGSDGTGGPLGELLSKTPVIGRVIPDVLKALPPGEAG